MSSNPPLTPATRQLYNALAVVRMAAVTITTPDDHCAGNDPYEVERWASAELEAFTIWRMSCQRFTMAAQVGPSSWERQKTLLRGFVAVWLAERFPAVEQARDCDELVACVVAAIDALGAELGIAREALAA